MTFSLEKILTPAILLLTISALSACENEEAAGKGPGGRPNMLQAEVYVTSGQSFSRDITASGTLLPNEEIEIRPEISGRVTAIRFKEGSKVSKGQVLVELYNEDLDAQIKKLKAQKELQQKTFQRQKQLLDIGGISRQEYETTETQIAAIEADITYAEAQLRATRIIAPFNGTIGIRNISEGAVVSPSTVITTLQQVSQLKMDFAVPDRYYNSLRPGHEVYFSVTGINDTLKGTINAIDPGAQAATRTVRVRAIISNPDNQLVAGSFAQVFIPLRSDENAILVPSQAVIPTSRDKQMAVVKDGKVSMVTVELGARTNDKVEVTNGLQAGDTVILTGLMQLKPGMEVKITKARS